ncbi:hypothetical protein F8M41_016875 [Gigaspora margarita]|uniref:Uncharacterized protein n=1 Tax=Gigaspora margarita TaxID=4874 RepID=A0A8H4ANX2_GIGMA|nr:hypothetical protein F8M41_016875 [Gigaspora margarita]
MTLPVPSNAIIGIVNILASIPALSKCKNITPPKNKKTSTTNTNDNNDFQQSSSDESSSSKLFAKSSLLLENFVEDNTQQPFNTIDIDDNDTQQNSGKNTIEADTIEADDNDTQQYSSSQAISDNTLNNSIPKSKKIIEKKKSKHLICSTCSKMTKNSLSKKAAVEPKKQATSNKLKKIKY